MHLLIGLSESQMVLLYIPKRRVMESTREKMAPLNQSLGFGGHCPHLAVTDGGRQKLDLEKSGLNSG